MAKRLLLLFWDMFRIALFVIGGGYAIIAVADAVFSKKRKTISEGELLGALPVFQMVPGIMAGHAAVYVGRKTAGFAGSLVALAGVALPSVLVFSAVSAGYDFVPLGNRFVEAAFTGLRASLAGIIFAMVARSWRKCVAGLEGWVLFAVAFSLLAVSKIPATWVIASAISGGVAVASAKRLKSRFNSFSLLPLVFFKYGLIAFGGGYVLVPVYLNDFVGETAKYLSVAPEEFANVMALTQMTPGPIGINAATYFGYRMCGFPGALAATAALLVPGFAILTLVLSSLEKNRENPFLKDVFAFIRPVSMAMMCSAFVVFAKMAVRGASGPMADVVAALVCIATAMLAMKTKIPMTLVILLGAAASLCWRLFV